jgi:hypothetical protein
MNTKNLQTQRLRRYLIALFAVFLAFAHAGCGDDGSDTEDSDVTDSQEDLDSDQGDTDTEAEIEEDTQDTDAEPDTTVDSESDTDTTADGDSLTPFEQIAKDGCEAFDACGDIGDFGGSVSACINAASSLALESRACEDQVEASFGCARDADSCDFDSECGDEAAAVADCNAAQE